MNNQRTLSTAACAFLSALVLATAGLAGCSKGGKDGASDTGSVPSEGTLTVTVYAYCPCSKCNTRQWRGMVSTGQRMQKLLAEGKNICAVDPKVIPMGATVTYNGKDYIAADTGGTIKGNTINILLGSHKEVYEFGKKENQTITFKK